MAQKQHLIFDFDGVIADTFDVLSMLTAENATNHSDENFAAHHDGNVYETAALHFPEGAMERQITQYSQRLGPSHIAEALPYVKKFANKYTLHIISSNAEAPLLAVLVAAGIRDCFDSVMGMETHRSKVEKFKMFLSAEGIEASDTLFVTDTLGDVREAVLVGIPTIAETFGFHNRERLAQGNPYRIVDSWDEIEQEVDEYFTKKV